MPALKTQLINTLRSYGMEVIGATPCRPNWQAVRPQEITSWLQAYHETAGTPERPYVASFAAIDDRPLLSEQGGDGLRGHFVRTRVSVGITERAAQRMVQLLTEPEPGAAPIPGLPLQMQQTQAQGAVTAPESPAAAALPTPDHSRAVPPSSSLYGGSGISAEGGGVSAFGARGPTTPLRGGAAACKQNIYGGAQATHGGAATSSFAHPTNGHGFGARAATGTGSLGGASDAYGLGTPSLAGRALPTIGAGGVYGSGRPATLGRRPQQPPGALRIGGGAAALSARVGGAGTFGGGMRGGR